MITTIRSDGAFDRALADAENRTLLLCFTSSVSLHWNQFEPTVEDFAYRFSDIDFYKIDVDENGILGAFSTRSPGVLPAFYFFRNGEEIDSVIGASEKELRTKLKNYSEIKDAMQKGKCCCCIPLGATMVIIGVITAFELGYNTWYSYILKENEGSIIGLIFWFLLKLAAVLSFVHLAFRKDNVQVRKVHWITYGSTQLLELIVMSLWLLIAWTNSDYSCIFVSSKCIYSSQC